MNGASLLAGRRGGRNGGTRHGRRVDATTYRSCLPLRMLHEPDETTDVGDSYHHRRTLPVEAPDHAS